MLPFDTETESEPILSPRDAPSVKVAFRVAQEAMAQLDSLIARWKEVCRVKDDHYAGEEAWQEADVSIAELQKTIPAARVVVRRAEHALDTAMQEATARFTEQVRARWPSLVTQFIEEHLRPTYEAHCALIRLREADEAAGVNPRQLPDLFFFLAPETATAQSGLCEFVRNCQRHGWYTGNWLPTQTERDGDRE